MSKMIVLSFLLFISLSSHATSYYNSTESNFGNEYSKFDAAKLFKLPSQAGKGQELTPEQQKELRSVMEQIATFNPMLDDEEQVKELMGELVDDLKDDVAPDMLKGCVTKTTCTGTGKDRVCESWEVYVSN